MKVYVRVATEQKDFVAFASYHGSPLGVRTQKTEENQQIKNLHSALLSTVTINTSRMALLDLRKLVEAPVCWSCQPTAAQGRNPGEHSGRHCKNIATRHRLTHWDCEWVKICWKNLKKTVSPVSLSPACGGQQRPFSFCKGLPLSFCRVHLVNRLHAHIASEITYARTKYAKMRKMHWCERGRISCWSAHEWVRAAYQEDKSAKESIC